MGWSHRSRLPLLLLVALVVGCGEGGPPAYQLQGGVKYNEKPVPTGWVIFLSDESKKSTAEIGADGSFQTELPAGQYRVGVSAPRESDKTGMEAFDEAPRPPHVPYRFADPKYSGLQFTVEENDDNRLDINLADRRRRRR